MFSRELDQFTMWFGDCKPPERKLPAGWGWIADEEHYLQVPSPDGEKMVYREVKGKPAILVQERWESLENVKIKDETVNLLGDIYRFIVLRSGNSTPELSGFAARIRNILDNS